MDSRQGIWTRIPCQNLYSPSCQARENIHFDRLRHGDSVFPVLLEEPPHSVASYGTQREMENLGLYFNPDPHGSPAIVRDTLHVSPEYSHCIGYFDITARDHRESGTIVQRYDANKELLV
jgi:hypothetical protein